MSEVSLLAADFAILIVTVTVLSFLAQRTGQPKIVAYIISGIVLGPVLLNVVSETELISMLSELGLAFLLFLIGIEMDFEEIRDIFKPVTRIALFQTVMQTSLAFAVSYFLGFSLIETFILAMATVFGSTPEVVKLLSDKDEISTLPAKIDVGVLLVQDVILIVTLALLSAPSLTSIGVVAWSLAKIVVLIAFIGGISYLASQHILGRHFRNILGSENAFFIHGIAWAFLFIFVSEYLQISVEIGAFLAGLSLGQMQYSSEMKERIQPLTDFFMVVFFSGIGLSLTRTNLFMYWREALFASIFLMAGNFLIMFYLIDREKFTPETSFKGSINMTQVSEFSLVVGALAVSQGFIGEPILGYLSLMAVMTMAVSAYFINYNEQIYQRVKHILERFNSGEKKDVAFDALSDHAVMVGYTDLARSVLPIIEEYFDDIVIVDRHPGNVEELSMMDHEYIFGDFKHGGIRTSASIRDASFIISFSDEDAVNMKILEDRSDDAAVFVRAKDRTEAADLYDLGADYIIRKNVLAVEKFIDHLRTYLNDRNAFIRETLQESERLIWGAHDG